MAKFDVLGERFWRGKVFDRETRILRNRIDRSRGARRAARRDGRGAARCPEGRRARSIPAVPGEALIAASRLLDARRESIIIDYAYTDDLPGYLEPLDHLVGRNGLRIRDEIRMVRPGFYLGRAYMDRFFVLNFTLYDEAAPGAAQTAAAPAADCFTGEQRRQAAVAAH